MIAIFVLLTQMIGGGFAMMPYESLDACQAAMGGLPPSLVAEAQCVPIEMNAPASQYAPEMAPLPVPKAGQAA